MFRLYALIIGIFVSTSIFAYNPYYRGQINYTPWVTHYNVNFCVATTVCPNGIRIACKVFPDRFGKCHTRVINRAAVQCQGIVNDVIYGGLYYRTIGNSCY